MTSTGTPCVGIFWGISGPDGSWQLLSDKTPIAQAEPYGDCLTHGGGHYEFWEGLKAWGATELALRSLPAEPATHEYEDFPRGRIVYWPKPAKGSKSFVIYADRRLRNSSFISQLLVEFSIPDHAYVVRSDPHYSRSNLA